MPVPIVFNDPTVQGVSNYCQIVPFAKSQWSGLSGNLRNFKYNNIYVYNIYIYMYIYIYCILYIFAHFGSFYFMIRHTFTGKVNSCWQPSTAVNNVAISWQVE